MGQKETEGPTSKKVLMVAGEASGDLQGAHLMGAIQCLTPGIHFFGVGGDQMAGRGMELLHHSHSLSVVGITEVLLKLRSIMKAFRALKGSLDQNRPDLVILIDFPDFNLRLAKHACQRGIPVLYYISPQVWAWRPGRVKRISRWVKKMVVFFPFEVPIYEAAGMDVEWVGHPLVDIVKPTASKGEACQQFGLNPGQRIIGLLPGSRTKEVERLLPPLLASAQLLRREIPALQFILPLAPGISKATLFPLMEASPVAVKVVEGRTYDVMNLSDLLIMASGTATLEGAILGKPMVIIYKISFLSSLIALALVHVDHIGLVNLVAGKRLVPELTQRDVNPKRIAEEALRILKNPILYQQITQSMEGVRQRLGRPGAAARAARVVYSLLHEREA